ncbi:carboxypeptidase-like regulatory domain-containing protein [Empedobacter stercoris]|uniref:carboxypeptidase-like regulatory domain-containing protein n=1 Tax=Empedobacter stercoris TaxID=1628248 RepID=UPI0021AF1F13|nr:carboxypeptidase-like regulatory domain-containing protein [Empedobacter stercoris]UWX67013.1 carboxypeptidase-like regulatory domain-containing protein [Empedobacter stercoris]
MELQIEKKCKQNWMEMNSVSDQQKFCEVCSKRVHDLDHYSFKELKTFLNDNPAACVKIKTRNLEQFNSYEASHSIANQSKKWLQFSSLVGFLSFSTLAKAQTENDSIVVQGIINDGNGFPEYDIPVNLKNSKNIVYTNENGEFKIKVPKNQDSYTLEYGSFGIKEFTFTNPSVCQNIKTETGDVLLGEVVYHKKSLFFRKIGRTITWPFRQIGKIF